DGDEDVSFHHVPERMEREIGRDAQPEIRERAHGQGNAIPRETCQKRAVLDGAIAVIDAPYAENVERLPDVVGRTFLAGMRGEEQTGVARTAEDAREFLGRVPHFR